MTPFVIDHANKAARATARELTNEELDFVSGGADMQTTGTGTFTRTLRGGQWHDDGIQDDSWDRDRPIFS
jgi:hypothetical protein